MKKDLYLDFDSTLVNSEQAVCDLYNERYCEDPDFVPARGEAVVDWGFENQCPLLHRDYEDGHAAVTDLFGTEAFFERLSFYPGAKEGVEALSKAYHVIITTAATPKNASRKVLWIDQHLPFVSEVVVIINKKAGGVGKGRVTMLEEGAIFVDDHPSNLYSTQASRKILYKYKDTRFNEGWEGETVDSWPALMEALGVQCP